MPNKQRESGHTALRYAWLLIPAFDVLLANFLGTVGSEFAFAMVPGFFGAVFVFTGLVNLVYLAKCSLGNLRIATAANVSTGIVLLLIAASIWERNSSPLAIRFHPFACFLFLSGAVLLGHAVYQFYSARRRFTLVELFWTTAFASLLFAILANILRLDNLIRSGPDQTIALRVQELGGNCSWEKWRIVGISLRGSGVDDSDIEFLSGLRSLRFIDMSGTSITDRSISFLRNSKGLMSLTLDDTQIIDSCMPLVTSFRNLSFLSLNNCSITDEGLRDLKLLHELWQLYLMSTDVSNEGLNYLVHNKRMSYLHLPKTQVTQLGVAHLSQSLPHCRIYAGELDK